MDNNYIRSLIEKFELSLDENERMVNSLNSLGDILGNLDKSISKVDKSVIDFYKLNDLDNIAEKSMETIKSLQLLKKQSKSVLDFVNEFRNIQEDLARVQEKINGEYEKLVDLNSERLSLKEEIDDFKSYIEELKLDASSDFDKIHINNKEIKNEILSLSGSIDTKYETFKEDILSNIEELLKTNNERNEYISTTIQAEIDDKVVDEHDIEQLYKCKNVYKIIELASKGDQFAQDKLGDMYKNGDGVDRDYDEAIKWYTKSANQDNLYAQYNLGFMYHKGYGVNQDYDEAVKWYTKSANQGNSFAQCKLGFMYYHGYGINQNYDEAIKWYTKSANQGNSFARNILDSIKM